MATITHSGTLPDSADKTDFYAIIDNGTVGSIVNADIAAGAAIADSKLATISTTGKVNTSALTTTSQAAGDILYNDGTNWVRLGKSAGKMLISGASAVSWGYPTGSVVQVVNTITGAVATGTTALPYDDSIPTSAEGDQYMSAAISPTSSANSLKIDSIFLGSPSGADEVVIALFQGSSGDAIAVNATRSGTNELVTVPLTHYMTAGTTASTTFRIRAARSAGSTLTFNGVGGSRYYGGKAASSLTITEIQA